MQIPLQITLRDMGNSEAVETAIREKVAKLEQSHVEIISCRVTVEIDGRHKSQGKEFSVGIDIKVPAEEIAINKHQNEDVYIALRDAFAAARRKLDEHARLRRGDGRRRHSDVAGHTEGE